MNRPEPVERQDLETSMLRMGSEARAAAAELALVPTDAKNFALREAARALSVPEGTLTSRLFRARDRVARRLEPGDEDPQPKPDQ